MTLGDEVSRLETENARLREIESDIGLIQKALEDLLQIVQSIRGKALTETYKDDTPEAVAENETTQQYMITKEGEDLPSLPYKVDAGQFIEGGDF
tara:strand:+ start:2316 stop:2600 length:285 start_codon:yes stop_codon:yes gene_type:complete